jgi:hypothetical protein
MVVKFPQLWVKKPNKARVDFIEKELRRFLIQHGLPMTWESAARCPCVREITTLGVSGVTWEPRTDCAACNGTGWLYFNPQPVTGFVLGAASDPDLFTQYGEYASGMVRLTLAPEHKPSVGDRFSNLNSTVTMDEVRTRTSETIERLMYPIATRTIEVGSDADPSVAEEIEVGVVYCRRADINGELESNLLEQDTDFTITAAGAIDWTLGDGLGTAPVEGARYGLKYYLHPTYIVQGLPYQHRDQFVKTKRPALRFAVLPTRADCWCEFLGDGGTRRPAPVP